MSTTFDLDAILDLLADRIAERLAGRAPEPQTALLSVPAVAARIGRSVDAVYQLIHRGKLPHVKSGKRVHVEAGAVERFIDAGRVG